MYASYTGSSVKLALVAVYTLPIIFYSGYFVIQVPTPKDTIKAGKET